MPVLETDYQRTSIIALVFLLVNRTEDNGIGLHDHATVLLFFAILAMLIS